MGHLESRFTGGGAVQRSINNPPVASSARLHQASRQSSAAPFTLGATVLELLELGFDDVRVAVGTDAVAEGDVGVIFDITLDLLPVVLIVADLLAV